MSAASLQDADPEAWKDPTPERALYDAEVLKRDKIGSRIRKWEGARCGGVYEALIAEWKAAAQRSDAAYDAMIAAAKESE